MTPVARRAVVTIVLCAVVLVAGIVAVRSGLLGNGGPADPHGVTVTPFPPEGRTHPPALADGPMPDAVGAGDDSGLSPRDPENFRRDGLVLQDVTIDGSIELTGDNQTLRNVVVAGRVLVKGDSVTIEDSSVGALSVSGASGFVARRLEVFGLEGSDGIHITSDTGRVTDALIEDSWIHSPQVTADSHYDGIQVRGVDGLTIRGSYIDLGPYRPQYTAAVFVEDANGGNTRVLIEDSWINGGGYTVSLAGTDVVLRNNVFGPDAEFGLRYPNDTRIDASGNILQSTGEPADL